MCAGAQQQQLEVPVGRVVSRSPEVMRLDGRNQQLGRAPSGEGREGKTSDDGGASWSVASVDRHTGGGRKVTARTRVLHCGQKKVAVDESFPASSQKARASRPIAGNACTDSPRCNLPASVPMCVTTPKLN